MPGGETGQARLSFHLKTLKDAGLARGRWAAGRWVSCSLEPAAVGALEAFLGLRRASCGALDRVTARRRA